MDPNELLAIVRKHAQMFALVAEMHAINADIEGMKANNIEQLKNGYALAYDQFAFIEATGKLNQIAKRLREEI